VRECAEAQSKDFGVIATDKGWNSVFNLNLVLINIDFDMTTPQFLWAAMAAPLP
jgi:hypothetical protein